MKKEARSRRLWVFDFDGTLSTLVPNRHSACLHTQSREFLEKLVAHPGDRVAVLSSRALDDLIDRIPIPQVLLGGCSGLEWQLPGGERISPGHAEKGDLEETRRRVLPVLEWIGAFPGVELEDKRWSVSVHYRRVLSEKIGILLPLITVLNRLRGIRLFEGPFVIEVQFAPMGDKSFGVQRLCRLLDFDPTRGEILYAGDDENDAVAMRWVLSHKGTVFSVGDGVHVEGARQVDGPASLARAIRAMIDNS